MCKVELLSGQIAAQGMISCWISAFKTNIAHMTVTENKQNPQIAMMEALRVWGAGGQEISGVLYFSFSSGIPQWFTPVINSVVGQGNSQLLNLHFKSEQFPALSSCLLQCLGGGGNAMSKIQGDINGLYPFVFLSLFFLTKNCYFGFDHLSLQGVAFAHMNTPSL